MAPTEAAATPLPREETTPPVMKMYLVAMGSGLLAPSEFRPIVARSARPERPQVAPTTSGGQDRSPERRFDSERRAKVVGATCGRPLKPPPTASSPPAPGPPPCPPRTTLCQRPAPG